MTPPGRTNARSSDGKPTSERSDNVALVMGRRSVPFRVRKRGPDHHVLVLAVQVDRNVLGIRRPMLGRRAPTGVYQ